MATEVKIPALGESISSGILAAWHVQDGAYVEKEQVLYELETDKITSEGTAETSGVISLSAAEGDEVEIGQVVATIDESAKKPSGDSEEDDDSEEEEEAEDSQEDDASEEEEEAPKKKSATGKTSEQPAKKKSSDEEPAEKPSEGKQQSPAVKRIAAESGVDPETVEGSGKGGRVTKGDMMEAIAHRDPSMKPDTANETPAAPGPQPGATDKGSRQSRRRMSPLRQRIAQRLVQAQQEAAILTTFNEADMSAVMGLRKKHQEKFVEAHGLKLGFMSFFVKAVVHALQQVPALNAQIDGSDVVENHYYDIGVAVSTDKGLLVPVLRDCEKKSFAEIEQDIAAYAKKGREGKITIDDLSGGVFTISNGGIFGSMLSTPILNPPQPGILGMHTIQERPVAVNGEVVIRPMMYLALSYDHRLVDGKEAVGFLVKIKEAIEDPSRLLFGV